MNRLLSRLRALGHGRHPRYTLAELADPGRDDIDRWEHTSHAVEALNEDLGQGEVRDLLPPGDARDWPPPDGDEAA